MTDVVDDGPELSRLLSGATGTVTLERDRLYVCRTAVKAYGSHQLAVIQNGASILRRTAKQGKYGHSQIIVKGCVDFAWYGGRVVGHKLLDQGYLKSAEGIHGVQIMSSTNVSLVGWELENVQGDAFYIGGKKGPLGDRLSRGIRITDSEATEMGRHCTSVTGGDDIVVSGCTFRRWHGNVKNSVEQPAKWGHNIHLLAGNVYEPLAA